MVMKVFTDGGARGNPGPAAGAFVVYDGALNMQVKRGNYLGIRTNNEAEYEAVIMALEYIKENKVRKETEEIHFNLDSTLVVNQLNGKFKVKEARLKEFIYKVRELEGELSGLRITYSYVPREENFEADRMVNETLDNRQK